MHQPLDASLLQSFRVPLDNHPVYAAVASLEDLQCFMQHHVYSVWDFMSLIKYLQGTIAPTRTPWVPRGDAAVRRFINELVLEEESDATQVDDEFSSHFELYLRAMQEVGADSRVAQGFVATAGEAGIHTALNLPHIPEPSRAFTRQTFAFIQADKPHQVAAALALGREHIIPDMFRAILARTGVTPEQAPIFHFYLNRHIHLDEDFHAPLSLRLLNSLCGHDEQKTAEAIEAAQQAVQARLALWDGVLAAIQARQTRKL